jgi:hypothetical protein
LPCKHLIVRRASYTAMSVTRDMAAKTAGRDAAIRSGNNP